MPHQETEDAAAETQPTRTRILDAAEELFALQGFAGTSVREIAARVGLNQASIYNHFSGKQALYEAVLERGFRPLIELLASLPEHLTTKSLDRLTEQLVEQLWRTPRLPKLVAREVLDNGEVLERLTRQWLRPIYEKGLPAIQSGPGRVRWRDEELPLLIIAFYHLLFGHFASAALLERVVGVDPLSAEMRRLHAEFMKKAGHRLLGLDPAKIPNRSRRS